MIELNYSITSASALTADGAIIAFAVFNLRNERVYRIARAIRAEQILPSGAVTPEAAELYAAAEALSYFSHFIRHRYYDEHFATILDEDYVLLRTRTPLPMPDTFPAGSALRSLADRLTEYRERETVSFTTAEKNDSDMVYCCIFPRFQAITAVGASGALRLLLSTFSPTAAFPYGKHFPFACRTASVLPIKPCRLSVQTHFLSIFRRCLKRAC